MPIDLSTGAAGLRLAFPDAIDLARIHPARRQQVGIIAASVHIRDGNTIATFGAGPQRKLSGLLDQVLAGAKALDFGVAAGLAGELAAAVAALDLPALRREAEGKLPMLARLPVLGQRFSALRRFQAAQKAVAERLAGVAHGAATHRDKLQAGDAPMARLLDAAEDNLRELEAWVAGGQQGLVRLRAEIGAERTPPGVPDPAHAAKFRDKDRQTDALEARLVRMQGIAAHGLLSVPQMRLAQQAGRAAIQDTLDIILATLPDLQAAIAGHDGSHGHAGELGRLAGKMRAALDEGVAAGREAGVKHDQAVQHLGEMRNGLLEGTPAQAEAVRQPQGTEFR